MPLVPPECRVNVGSIYQFDSFFYLVVYFYTVLRRKVECAESAKKPKMSMLLFNLGVSSRFAFLLNR